MATHPPQPMADDEDNAPKQVDTVRPPAPEAGDLYSSATIVRPVPDDLLAAARAGRRNARAAAAVGAGDVDAKALAAPRVPSIPDLAKHVRASDEASGTPAKAKDTADGELLSVRPGQDPPFLQNRRRMVAGVLLLVALGLFVMAF